MRRWNGWGDESVSMPLSPRASRHLAETIGPAARPSDAALADVLALVPPSRLPAAAAVVTDPLDRLLHARGQSLPDWIALRTGRIGPFPDGVAYPETAEEVRSLIRLATKTGVRLIPYGGGTSVVGHINPPAGDPPVLTVDLLRMSVLKALDRASHLATFGAGVKGPDLEAALRAHGFTLGHFPQSFEMSTLGGWIATRGSGQQSLGFGRIERLFAGGHLESPAGPLELPVFPASAAGPDLREVLLGSEGRLGVLTEATVRLSPLPEREDFIGVFFPNREAGLTATRGLSQARLPLSMLRLSTARETAVSLLLSPKERLVGALEGYLALRGVREGKCLLLVGLSGRDRIVRTARREAMGLLRRLGGVVVGSPLGRSWQRSRFLAPYLRNTLWEAGYAVDTLETAAPWSAVPALLVRLEAALAEGLQPAGDRVEVFSHLSHLYPDGSSIYVTFLYRLAADPDENLARWRTLKEAASRAIVEGGGTISHQHGVGVDHLPYLRAEKGALGLSALGSVCRQFDPEGLMNPGKLVP